MGRGALGLLLSTGPVIMKVLWVTLLVVLVLFVQSEAKKGKGKGKGKPKPKPCLKDDKKLQLATGFKYGYDKFTETQKVKKRQYQLQTSDVGGTYAGQIVLNASLMVPSVDSLCIYGAKIRKMPKNLVVKESPNSSTQSQ